MLRAYCVVALGMAVSLAFFSRGFPVGIYAWDMSMGDVLWSFALYVAIVLVMPRWAPWKAWCLAAAMGVGVEAFKLTGLPMEWRGYLVSRLLFGTTPSVHNLVCYGIGMGMAFGLHVIYHRSAKRIIEAS